MTRTILFFGRIADRAVLRSLDCAPPVDIRTVQDLVTWLCATRPDLAAALAEPGMRVALDQTMTPDLDAPLGAAREIAFMSPLSGG
ncbi:MAG: MoaD/ThiS family protein [Alphaproteobacteria bacterium]|nr:MoaD/ThiS family protein [Alphaproteobacteria bacterium]